MNVMVERPLASHLEGVEGSLRHAVSMSKYTSWRVGGEAEMFFTPNDKSSVVQLMCQLPGNIDVFWFGLGSNLLVRDGGISGMVVCTHKGLGELRKLDNGKVYVQSGVPSAKVAKFCARNSLEGAEFLAGIPGSFGGAVAMNAGAFGGEIWPLIERIECLDRDGNITWFDKSEINFSYRNVDLPKNQWVLAAELKLKKIKGLDLARRIKKLLKMRSASQPIQSANAGSVFRNPENDYAARLLEEAGLKGLRIGQAEVSNKHANFIINLGGAKAADIEALILKSQKAVHDRFGVWLEPEIRIVGQAENRAGNKLENSRGAPNA